MSNIEWTDTTWNPVVGCTPVSPGCLNCYAATMARRLEAMHRPEYVGLTVKRKGSTRAAGPEDATPATAVGKVSRDVFNGTVRTLEDRLADPLHWRKPRRVFVNSMSDLFHEDVPFEFIDRVFAVMNATGIRLPIPEDVTKAKPWHTYQVLTKRPDRMAEYLLSRSGKFRLGQHPLFRCRDLFCGQGPDLMNASAVFQWPLPNVWLGTSVEDQPRADERIPHLLKCPAAVRFLSCEPLLGPVDIRGFWTDAAGPNLWVIVGGESGAHARPCDIQWIRWIVSQCNVGDVPCFVKQLGAAPKRSDEGCEECQGTGRDPDVGRCPFCTGGHILGGTMKLRDAKGGDPSEWPEDLRVREMPTPHGGE